MDIQFGKPDYYDVTPDGQRFLVAIPPRADEGTRARVVVVGNWPALKR